MSHQTARTLVVGLVAAVWAASFIGAHDYKDLIPSGEEADIAIHLANGHGYRSPMDPSPTAPLTAWSAPVYPLVIGTAYRLFGVESRGAIVLLQFLNILVFGAIASGIYRLSNLVFRAEGLALLAAGLVSFHPLFVSYMANIWDGMVSLAFFLWLTVAAVQLGMAAEAGIPIGGMKAIALGVGMGVLALTNTSYIATYPVLVLVAFRRCLSRARLRLALLTLAAVVLVVSPWTTRNYLTFGRLVVVRTGLGINLWLGNAPGGSGWLDTRALEPNPYTNAGERQLILRLGEPAYEALAVQRFRREFAEDRAGFFTRCLRRALLLLLGEPTEPLDWGRLSLNGTVAALGFTGMFAAWRRGYRQRGLPALVAAVTLPFLPTGIVDRYRLPVLCLLLLYAAALLWMFVPRKEDRNAIPSSG